MERKTKAEMEVLKEKLLEQMEAFTMEIQYEKMQVEFREMYEAWYAGRITLDEVLDAAMQNMKLCRDIGVWK